MQPKAELQAAELARGRGQAAQDSDLVAPAVASTSSAAPAAAAKASSGVAATAISAGAELAWPAVACWAADPDFVLPLSGEPTSRRPERRTSSCSGAAVLAAATALRFLGLGAASPSAAGAPSGCHPSGLYDAGSCSFLPLPNVPSPIA
eukprot:CAMPEP_0179904500 /NCGR_PEP_ID=MMETSP0982-20121206/41952_1 /TAXON_ID=483367 /ORGANISM="non described non described, Strain CCMP 2436" /LENGTH=148 /DNA_ID=CAMNT_0021804361 /DNA_START=152 /DNA_END=600 /DNA_ORIENTATION=-